MTERSPTGVIVTVALVCCVLLAGCSGGPSGATTTATGSEASSTPSPTVTEGTTDPDDRTTTGTPETTAARETTDGGTETGDGTTPAGGNSRSALVTRVIDGDTIEIRYPNGTADTVRLLGVDTPETSGEVSPEEFEGIPDTEAGRTHLREWADRAKTFAREELSGEQVQVVTDPAADRRGRYGRLLAYVVRSDGNRTEGRKNTDESEASESEVGEGNGEVDSFNAALLREGYARVYDSSFGERERYEAIEARAKERNVGLWGFGGEESTASSTEVGDRIYTGTPIVRSPGPNHESATLRRGGLSSSRPYGR